MRQLCSINWQTLPVQWLVPSGLSSYAACSISVGRQWIWLWAGVCVWKSKAGGRRGRVEKGRKGRQEPWERTGKILIWFITSFSFQHSTATIDSVIILHKYAKVSIRIRTAGMNTTWQGIYMWNFNNIYGHVSRNGQPLKLMRSIQIVQ